MCVCFDSLQGCLLPVRSSERKRKYTAYRVRVLTFCFVECISGYYRDYCRTWLLHCPCSCRRTVRVNKDLRQTRYAIDVLHVDSLLIIPQPQ